MSSGGSSPMRFSGRPDYDYEGGFDPSFSADINNRMRVPKNIRVGGSGEGSDTDEVNANWSRSNGTIGKIPMQVPDRIIVAGQDQHVGTKALPRELQLANVDVPVDPEHIRIMTPPRSITLTDPPLHNFNHNHSRHSEGDDDTLVVENNQARFVSTSANNRLGGLGDTSIVLRNRRGSVVGYDDSDEIQAEMEHMREQLGRLNSRLLAVEDEVNSSKERELYLILGAFAYITIHACSWLFKSSNR